MKKAFLFSALLIIAFTVQAQKEVKIKWYDWDKTPASIKAELKKIKASKTKTLYQDILDDIEMDKGHTKVSIGVLDMDGDGIKEYTIIIEGPEWSGAQGGCSIEVFKDLGKKRILLTDHFESIKFVKNGIISSTGVLIKFENISL